MGYVWYGLTLCSLLLQCFLATLGIAAGLYYLAELVEEFTTLAGRIIKYVIWASLPLHLLLYTLEELPLSLTLTGVTAHLLHLSLLAHFPFFFLTSPPALSALGVFLAQHYFAYSHFLGSAYYTPQEVVAYMLLLVWLVPFSFFVSLSANENILPTQHRPSEDYSSGGYFTHPQPHPSLSPKRRSLLSFFQYLGDEFFPRRPKKAY